jgi:hypothetical protein
MATTHRIGHAADRDRGHGHTIKALTAPTATEDFIRLSEPSGAAECDR